MAVRFGKLIVLFLIGSQLIFASCCCDNYIHRTTADIENYIKKQNLDIAIEYLKSLNQKINLIVNDEQKINNNLMSLINVTYNLDKKNGILLKEKNYNFILRKLNLLEIEKK